MMKLQPLKLPNNTLTLFQ